MRIYLLPGVGADHRLFEHFELPAHELVPLKWEPISQKISMEEYAIIMAQKVDASQPFVLLGVSMGGMLAIEMAKIIKPVKTILISSVKTWNEFPAKIRFIKVTGLYRLTNGPVLKWSSKVMKPILGPRGGYSLELCREMLEDTPTKHFKWSVRAIVNWKNYEIPKDVVHIQGDEDWTLPHKNVKYDYLLKGGTHFMIHNRGKEISTLVAEILKDT